jgi:hypothetical protein
MKFGLVAIALSAFGVIYGQVEPTAPEKCMKDSTTATKWQCKTGQKCCGVDGAFFCVPDATATCCSDGKSACPAGKNCNGNRCEDKPKSFIDLLEDA